MNPEVILHHRVPIRLSITLSPPSEESSEMRKWHVTMCYTEYHQSGSFADPNFRLHKSELRGYACIIYEQQITLLLSYLTVDKTVSVGLNYEATCRDCSILSLVFRVAVRTVTSDLTINDLILLLSLMSRQLLRKNSVKTV